MDAQPENGCPVSVERLLAAASAAREFLLEYREELLDSYCVPNADGTRDRSTADAVESEHLSEVETLIEGLHLAINPRTPQ